jgi:uncharacterized protein (TIGR02145 family)
MNTHTLFFSLYLLNSISAFSQLVVDVDGNTYNTVSIGNQIWLTENLKTTKFNNQDPIPLITDNTLWSTQTEAAYCSYQDDNLLANEYGNLYNWHVLNDIRNVCPTGYHVPSILEWEELIDFLGGTAVAGGKLKEAGLAHWIDPNTGATNSSGFTLLPSGWRAYNNGSYENLTHMAYQWSSTSIDALNASIMLVGFDSESCLTSESHKLTGLPIRCLKEETSSLMNNQNHLPIMVYPNPANHLIKIHCGKNTFHTVRLIDLTGKILLYGAVEDHETSLNISDIPNGTYLIDLQGDCASRYEKITIQH